MRVPTRRPFIRRLAAILLLAFTPPGHAESPDTLWTSTDGLYRLSIETELEPLVINRIHRWTLYLQDSSGNPVANADIEVTGGMPEHNHGLPTRPRITRELGDGRYRLEGMRFHMPGRWEISVSIDAAPGADTVVLTLDI